MFIPDPEYGFLSIPDPGSMVKKEPDSGSGSATQFMSVDIFFQRSKATRQPSAYLAKLLFKLKKCSKYSSFDTITINLWTRLPIHTSESVF
jgi:hypothetical protein